MKGFRKTVQRSTEAPDTTPTATTQDFPVTRKRRSFIVNELGLKKLQKGYEGPRCHVSSDVRTEFPGETRRLVTRTGGRVFLFRGFTCMSFGVSKSQNTVQYLDQYLKELSLIYSSQKHYVWRE